MNFVINLDTTKERDDVVCIEWPDGQYADVHEADLVYSEDRYDAETDRQYVCLIYRAPEADQ
jgi:hypothetical protein